MARVLVGFESSGIVREAFARRGHDAWSCDLRASEQPGQHHQGDIREVLDEQWDLAIFHPPTHPARTCAEQASTGTRGGRSAQRRRMLHSTWCASF